MKARDYFPLGKALGKAFCNRQEETEWLLKNLSACKHSLLIAPRRYGKSSLAERALEKSGLPVVYLNFNTCSDEKDVEQLIRQGVGELIGRALGPLEKIIHSIKTYASHLTPNISFGEYARLELTTKSSISPEASIEDILRLMEKLLVEKDRSAVILFDEFQVVGLIAKGTGVEAAIRNVAQDTKRLAMIFSGSSRTLLQTMFEDEKRPLYKLCRKTRLKRIEQAHYQKHINKAARLTWGKDLEPKLFDRIMQLSGRHPYYVNYLCDVLWSECSHFPKMSDIDRAWQIVIEEEKSDTDSEITSLPMGQKKILKYIANYSGNNLMSAEAVKVMDMALSSIASAVSGLIERDMIEKDEEEYRIINPTIKHLLGSSNIIVS